MNIKLIVKRQASHDTAPYTHEYSYSGEGNITVADWLTEINQGEAKTDRIAWECGCLENKCGACAMRINGYPYLACSVFLKDVVKRGRILIEPLSKFPVVKDLVVDRGAMFDMLKGMRVWTETKSESDFMQDKALQYKAAQCMQCGCCLEVCPNFIAGGDFAGAAGLVEAYRAIEQNDSDEHRAEMLKKYKKLFFSGCGQSLSCVKACPKKLPLDEIQARANVGSL